MKIQESVELINADKVTFGHKDIRLTLDTDTRRIEVDTPAMFVDPVVRLDELKEKIDKLQAHTDQADA